MTFRSSMITRQKDRFIYSSFLAILGWAGSFYLLGYARIKLSEPLSMGADSLQVWNFAKSYIDGFGYRFNPSLGFPGQQDNTYFPSFDFSYRFFLKIAAIFSGNPITTMQAMNIAGISAMYFGAVAGLRRLNINIEIAVICAIPYVVSPYFAMRAAGHDFLSLYFSAPLGAALGLILATMPRSTTLGQIAKDPFVIIAVVVAGTSGLYYGFFTCMFVALMTCTTAISRRWWQLAVAGLAISLIIGALLVTSGYGESLPDVLGGRIVQPTRSALEQLGFGLNIAEAVHVFADLKPLSWTLAQYKSVMPLMTGATGLFEWPGLLLTLIILASPVIVTVTAGSMADVMRSRRASLIFLASACLVFGLLYAVRGGLGYYFSMFVAPQVRATARIIPFLSFFALVIAAVFVQASLRSKFRFVQFFVPIIVLGSLIASMVPSVGLLSFKQQQFLGNEQLQSRIAGARKLLAEKNRAQLMTVLQLPNYPWPEVPAVRGFDPYGHQVEFILDEVGSKTRWSYGSTTSQPAFQKIETLVNEHPKGLASAARSFGFDSIVVEKLPYSPSEIAGLLGNIEEFLPAPCKIFEDEHRLLYKLVGKSGETDCSAPK